MSKSNHISKARELFLAGYNCTQSVFAAFADKTGMDEDTALKVAIGLGGGIGRLREVCGALSGAAMLCGFVYGNTPDNKRKNYEAVQKIAEEFKKRNGTYICRELLELKKDAKISSQPQVRDEEYYKKRPCLKMVEDAAEIAEQVLFN